MSSRLVVAKKPPLFPPLRVVVVVVVVVATRRVKVVVINTHEMILDRIDFGRQRKTAKKSRTPSTRDESLVWRGLFLDRRFLLLLLLLFFFLSALLSSNSSSSSDAFNRHRYAHIGMMMFWDHKLFFFFGGKQINTHTLTKGLFSSFSSSSSSGFIASSSLFEREHSRRRHKYWGQKHSSLFFLHLFKDS